MSRDSLGTYTLPAGNPVVSGTTISVAWANATLADLAAEITGSLSTAGKGGMLQPLQGFVGTASLPGYTFVGDTNTGLYWVSADDFAVVAGGTKVMEWNSTGVINSTPNGNGLTVTGNGTGTGAVITGGNNSGIGLDVIGGGTTGAALRATGATSGTGIVAVAGSTTGVSLLIQVGNGVLAPIRFQTSNQPTGLSAVGDMYVTAAGVLKICTVAGTPGTWVSVGTQT